MSTPEEGKSLNLNFMLYISIETVFPEFRFEPKGGQAAMGLNSRKVLWLLFYMLFAGWFSFGLDLG